MVASGKSSNRLIEMRRAARTGKGHGIYAAEGIRQYKKRKARQENNAGAIPPSAEGSESP